MSQSLLSIAADWHPDISALRPLVRHSSETWPLATRLSQRLDLVLFCTRLVPRVHGRDREVPYCANHDARDCRDRPIDRALPEQIGCDADVRYCSEGARNRK